MLLTENIERNPWLTYVTDRSHPIDIPSEV